MSSLGRGASSRVSQYEDDDMSSSRGSQQSGDEEEDSDFEPSGSDHDESGTGGSDAEGNDDGGQDPLSDDDDEANRLRSNAARGMADFTRNNALKRQRMQAILAGAFRGGGVATSTRSAPSTRNPASSSHHSHHSQSQHRSDSHFSNSRQDGRSQPSGRGGSRYAAAASSSHGTRAEDSFAGNGSSRYRSGSHSHSQF